MAEETPISAEQLEPSEVTDEDELGVDPLEGGMDFAERQQYIAADHYGMTATEQATARSWNSRLAEEQSDRPETPESDDGVSLPAADETFSVRRW